MRKYYDKEVNTTTPVYTTVPTRTVRTYGYPTTNVENYAYTPTNYITNYTNAPISYHKWNNMFNDYGIFKEISGFNYQLEIYMILR